MDARVAAPAYLRLAGIRKTFGSGDRQVVALGRVDLTVAEGEFVAIVGPSGCGKSTLLQIAAGLALPTEGDVSFRGVPVTAPPAGIVYLFQQYGKSLLPWRSVADNVAFAIEHRPGMTRTLARATSARFLAMVGLAEFGDRFPWQLSGGMQQRVTIARALAAEPRVLLMDEPFSSVDALTRLELHQLVLDLWQQHRFTAVLVTHDVDEAVFLADRITLLSARPSEVVQVFDTELPRPRDNLSTRELPRFLALRHAILQRLLGALMVRTLRWRDPERWLGAATIVLLLALLEAAVRAGFVNRALVPAPSTIAIKLAAIVAGGEALRPLAETLMLLAVAYAGACALAVGVGLLMGRFAFVHGLLEPLVEVFRPLPKPALLPPLILFLGIDATMKLTVIGLGVFFPVLVNTVQGVRGTEPVLLDAARTFGHGRARTLLTVVLPAALPMVLAGMRVSLGLGLVLVVVAEMMAGTGGVGYLILDMQRSFRVPEMYAWIVILAVLGWGLNALFVRLEGRFTHWSLATRE